MNKFKDYINNKEKQLFYIKRHGYNIKYIKNPDIDMQLIAIKENGNFIRYIKNPNKEIQLIAVKQKEDNIKYINNPNKEVILLAIKQNINNFKLINNISIETQEYLIKKIPNLLNKYPDKFNKSLRKKYKHLLVPSELGIFDE